MGGGGSGGGASILYICDAGLSSKSIQPGSSIPDLAVRVFSLDLAVRVGSLDLAVRVGSLDLAACIKSVQQEMLVDCITHGPGNRESQCRRFYQQTYRRRVQYEGVECRQFIVQPHLPGEEQGLWKFH